jgi:hypothetical protein
MPTFKKCPATVGILAGEVIEKWESHEPIKAAGVKIDYVFAFAAKDNEGNYTETPIKSRGFKVLGQVRTIKPKDRAQGRGDAEILLDGDHWGNIEDLERMAILDHELYHLEVVEKDGKPRLDFLKRPVLRLKHHDHEFGWFAEVAKRNGKHSVEQKVAKSLLDVYGQYYWPDIAKALPPSKALAEKVGEV